MGRRIACEVGSEAGALHIVRDGGFCIVQEGGGEIDIDQDVIVGGTSFDFFGIADEEGHLQGFFKR